MALRNDPYGPHLFDKFPGDWMDRGSCKGHDPELWFPEKSTPRPRIKIAVEICNACPVRQDCLDYALAEPPEVHGIWAGLTQKQLAKLRTARKRRGSAHGTRARYVAGCRCDDCRAADRTYKTNR